MSEEECLEMYVVYKHPLDFPDEWVVREYSIDSIGNVSPQRIYAKGKCLCDVVEYKPSHMVRFERNLRDDPCIVETWI